VPSGRDLQGSWTSRRDIGAGLLRGSRGRGGTEGGNKWVRLSCVGVGPKGLGAMYSGLSKHLTEGWKRRGDNDSIKHSYWNSNMSSTVG